MKLELTDTVIKNLIPESKKYTVWDTAQDPAGLAVRVRPTGIKTYVMIARPQYTGGKSRQLMVTLGHAGTMKLATARKGAWDALNKMQRGINPTHEKKKLQIESFGALAELYITEELSTKRQGKQVVRYIRADWMGQTSKKTRITENGRTFWKIEWKNSKEPIFRDRPAALITREDILARLNTIRRTRGA